MYFSFEEVNECEGSTLKHALLIALASDFEKVIFQTDS
jgi:hypothetical protein